MKVDEKLFNRIQAGLLAIFVVSISAGSIARMEARLFPARVSPEQMVEKTKGIVANSSKALKEIQEKVTKPLEGAFLLKKPQAVAAEGDPSAAEPTASIRIEGIVSMTDGTRKAMINGGMIAAGGTVSGCLVKTIEAGRVEVEVNGTNAWVNIFESYYFKPQEMKELVLERIETTDGRSRAVISGVNCGVGEWLDAKTRVMAITPTQVLVQRGDERILLAPPPAK
jgi:hypothetical protein